jgi:hypothetical protein
MLHVSAAHNIYTQWEVGPIDVQHNDKKQTAASNTRIELTETKEGTGMMVYGATTKKTFSNAF